MEFLQLLGYSGKAVGIIILVALTGAILRRRGILKDESLTVLSKLVFNLTLPALLITKVAASVDINKLKQWWVLPPTCVIYILFGLLIGWVVVKVFHPKPEFSRSVIACCGFGNSGYIPIPLLVAMTVIFPAFASRPEAGELAVSYISVYLIGFSPVMWSVGYTILTGQKVGSAALKNCVTPPIIAIAVGVLIGLTPLKGMFCDKEGCLNIFFIASEVVASATIPCALIVLGGKLAYGPSSVLLSKRVLICIVLGKLVLVPCCAVFYIFFLRAQGWMPNDPLMAMTLFIEAGTPPATNLVVMCSMRKDRNGEAVATVLFWTYLASTVTLTLLIMVGMSLFAG